MVVAWTFKVFQVEDFFKFHREVFSKYKVVIKREGMKQKRILSWLPLTHKRRFHFLMTYSSSCRISHWQMRSLYIRLNLSWASLATSIWSTALHQLVYQRESPAERKICCQNRKLQNKWLCVSLGGISRAKLFPLLMQIFHLLFRMLLELSFGVRRWSAQAGLTSVHRKKLTNAIRTAVLVMHLRHSQQSAQANWLASLTMTTNLRVSRDKRILDCRDGVINGVVLFMWS